jgi:hypothetical protein
VGSPLAASMAALRANGRAKMECSHLIISRAVLMLVNRGTGYFIEKGENKSGMPGGMPLEQLYALHVARV